MDLNQYQQRIKAIPRKAIPGEFSFMVTGIVDYTCILEHHKRQIRHYLEPLKDMAEIELEDSDQVEDNLSELLYQVACLANFYRFDLEHLANLKLQQESD